MSQARPQPFFMSVGGTRRFCAFHPPAAEAQGAILYVPPFAEEANKSRRMAALQARRFASRNYAVLLVDLYGCGDSDGELRDASWTQWKQDLHAAVCWLRARFAGVPVYLWGLRLGALLAVDYGREARPGIDGYVLWQPVISGVAHLVQFLRLRTAAGVTGAADRTTTAQLRETLKAGTPVEVAGYELTPALAADMARLSLDALVHDCTSVHWLEVATDEGGVPPLSRRVLDRWAATGAGVESAAVPGTRFWNSIATVDNPDLIAATERLFARAPAWT